jgi:hypothetical protein
MYVAAKGKSSSPLPAASILFRLSNNGNASLRRVSLSFISSLQEQDVKMSENIAPGESVEKVPFKVVLPCCLLFLKQKPGHSVSLSHDHIMDELSTGVWSPPTSSFQC